MNKIPGYEGYYADEDGNIYSSKRGPLIKMKKKLMRHGYEHVQLYVDRKAKDTLVHRLVLMAFSDAPADRHCNHKNGKRNDNRLSNLEWVTREENEQHAINVLGKNLRGTNHPLAKMTDAIVTHIRALRAQGRTYQSIADQFGIGLSHAARVANGEVWRHVP